MNNIEQPKKDNTLKIILIVAGVIIGIIAVVVIGIVFLFSTIFKTGLELFEEKTNEYGENNNSSTSGNNNGHDYGEYENGEEVIIQDSYSNIEKISFDTFKKMIDEKRSFVIVISQTYCSHCIAYKPVFNDVLKRNKINGYELDLLTIAQEDYEEFNNLLDVTGTPTAIIYVDGIAQKEVLEGNLSASEINNYLKKYGFTKN
jgi:thiol-disulfide isomerase/thioredoxin